MEKKLIIGTRGSKLALIQANLIKERLERAGYNSEITTIKTAGDKNQKDAIFELGGKGTFVKEIEHSLIAGDIDIAVHSLKDMPAKPAEGLKIGAYFSPEDPRDVLVSSRNVPFEKLPLGSRIGTGSPRRTAQIKLLRPDLKILPIRGNVDTRIKKVEDGEYDAAVLAYAGIKRLGLENKITDFFSLEQMIPAPGQGVIAVEAKAKDKDILQILAKFDDKNQRTISEIEFGILKKLGADCTTPIGMKSELEGSNISIKLFLSDPKSDKYIKSCFNADFRDIEDAIETLSGDIIKLWNTTLSISI